MKTDGTALKEIAERAARRLLAYPWKLWFWGDSVGLEGLLDATLVTRDGAYAGFVHGIMKAWNAPSHRPGDWEYTAAGVALMRVFATTGDPTLMRLARAHAEYLAGFRKSDGGIFIRYENAAFDRPPDIEGAPAASASKGVDGGPCAFVDTMHFDAPFFAALHQATGEERYRTLAIETLGPQIDLLFDRGAGLFHHFWIERTRAPNRVFWGRGNGWALLGLVRTMALLASTGEVPAKFLATLRRQVDALAQRQDASGHWHTVLDDPASYLETSIAAFVVDGFATAMRHGWIDASYRDVVFRAMAALIAEVQPDGLLAGVSYETFPSTHAEHYRRMPRGAMVPWGQGPLLGAIHAYTQLYHENP